MRHVYKILVGKRERKTLLGRPSCRWTNIEMDLREMGLEVLDWIRVAQDKLWLWAVVNTVMNLRFP
jgi:hypothetical protein